MTRVGAPAAMAAFAAAAVFGVLARPLLPIDETRYLAVAWGMRVTGDWLVPHLNGALYTDKPPLLFWLINLAWSVFGVSDTAARLVGPAFGAGAIGVTAALARRLWPAAPGVGGYAAFALAGLGAFTLFAGLTMFDAMLTFAVALGALALVETRRTPRAWLAFGAALGLGAFVKGPVVLIHLLPLALLAPVWSDARVGATLRGVAAALAVGLGLIGLWLVPAILTGGAEYRDAVLWSQHAGRVADSFAHLKPWWFFLALLPLLLWPWAWSPGVWRSVRRLSGDPGVRFCAIWAGSALLLFSLISGKQAHYLLPALPAAALVVGRALGADPAGSGARAPLAGLLPAALGLGLVGVAFGLAPGEDAAVLGQPAWAFALTGLALVGLGAAGLRLRGAGVSLLGLALAPIAALPFALGAPGRIFDAAGIGAALSAHDAHGVAILGQNYHGEFTFAGRLVNPVAELDDLREALAWLEAAPDRILVARLDRIRPDAPPFTTTNFRGRPYGLWRAAPAPGATPEDPAT